MTPEQITAARCKRCNGAGTIRVQRFTIFETDSAAESEFAFRNEVCPECSARGNKAELDITAARERCEKAQHLSLRTTQCCDVSIDGAIGEALEFITHARTDLPLALDDIAKKDAEIAELRSTVSDDYWDQNAVQCGNCSVQILTKGKPFKPGGKVSNGLSDTGSSEDEALCGMCAGEEMYRLSDIQEKSDARIAELERENARLNAVWCCVHDDEPLDKQPCPCCAAVEVDRLSAALKVAREAIEQSPDITGIDDEEFARHYQWKRDALAAIDAAATALPLPPVMPPQPT